MNTPVAPASVYRGSQKHKNRPVAERKGTLCPGWAYNTAQGCYENDPFSHAWNATQAHVMFEQAIHPPGSRRRYATANGIAFEAKPTGDGTWHGYPIPWESVPTAVLQQWLDEEKVTRRQIKRYWRKEGDDLHWAIEADLP